MSAFEQDYTNYDVVCGRLLNTRVSRDEQLIVESQAGAERVGEREQG